MANTAKRDACRKALVAMLLIFSSLWTVEAAHGQTTWTSGDFEVQVDSTALTISDEAATLIEVTSINLNFAEPQAVTVEHRSPDSLLLQLRYPPEARRHDEPGASAYARLRVTNEGGYLRFYSPERWPTNVSIQMNDLGGHYFGLMEQLYPHNRHSPDLRGEVVDVEVDGKGGDSYAERFASVWSAFFMNSRGYASFFDTFGEGQYTLGVDDRTEILHKAHNLDWYVFHGPDGDAMLEDYYDVIGTPKSAPAWAMGPVIWRDQNTGKDQILQDVERFTDLEIPVTAWWVDRPYSDGSHAWSEMNFSEDFANPEEWISTLNDEYGVEFMTWIAPMTFSAESDFPGLFPTYKGYFDLTDEEALAEFGRRLRTHQYAVGVKGHKMDRADNHFPVSMRWADGTPSWARRNKYPYRYAKVADSLLREAHGEDQFNFARTAYHRAQPYLSALWGGDVRSTWAGLSGNLANAMRVGFMGFPVWGSDVGGYAGEGHISKKLYARWLTWGSWSGFFEVKIDASGGSGKARPPWAYDEELQRIFRTAAERRMKMLPYLYSLANMSGQNGIMMKPLAYEYLSDQATYDVWNEYLLGDAFLVAPVFAPGGERSVYLPDGRWYDFNDPAQVYDGPRHLDAAPPLGRLPVFVRANRVYVTGNVISGNQKQWISDFDEQRALTIHAYPGQPGEEYAFDYKSPLGDDSVTPITVRRAAENRIMLSFDPMNLDGTLRVRCPRRPERVRLNDQEKDFEFDAETQVLRVTFEKNQPLALEVRL